MSPVWALLLSCGPASPPPPPHVAAGGSLDALADAYREALAAAGGPVCTWQHESAALRCLDGSRHDLRGLWAVVRDAPDPEAEARRLLAMVPQPALPATWPEARPFLLLRITAAEVGASRPLHPAHPEGPWYSLEAGLPGGTVAVPPAALDSWGVSWDEAAAAATAHIDAIEPQPFWPLAPGLARARVGDGHDPARLASRHLDALPYPVDRAVLVLDQTAVVGEAAAAAALADFARAWQAEHPGAAAWTLVREAEGWAPAAP